MGDCDRTDHPAWLTDYASKYPTLILQKDGQLGRVKNVEFEITLTDNTPQKQFPYRYSPTQLSFIRETIAKLRQLGILVQSDSDWASPVIVVEQPLHDSQPKRMCIDFRRLNAQTKKIAFQLPHIEACILALQGKKHFATIDIKSAYWQIPIKQEHQKLTTIATPEGTFQFTTVPDRKSVVEGNMQRITNKIVSQCLTEIWDKGLTDKCTITGYIDDFAIGADTTENLKICVDILFSKLAETGFKISLNKCEFDISEIKYLGFIVNGQGKRPDPRKLAAILEAKQPTNVAQVRSFLGMTNYYQKFTPSYAQRVEAIVKLTRKMARFEWNQACQKQFEAIKLHLTSPPILKLFEPEKPCILHIDASKIGIGCVLLQQGEDEHLLLVECASRYLSNCEVKLHINELEAIAAHWAITVKFAIYLSASSTITVFTDSNTLAQGIKKNKLNPRLAKIAADLQHYPNLQFKHFKGKQNVIADYLSRNPVEGQPPSDKSNNDDFYSHVIIKYPNKTLCEKQFECEEISPLRDEVILASRKPETDRDDNEKQLVEKYHILDGVLVVRKGLNQNEHVSVLPRILRPVILEMYHDLFGHRNAKKTEESISRKFYWQGMQAYIRHYCENCKKCLTNNRRTQKAPGLLQPHDIPLDPFTKIGIDCVGPLGKDCQTKHEYFVLIVDFTTKFAIVKTVDGHPNAVKLIKLLQETILNTHSSPKEIVCDAASYQTGDALKQFADENGIKLTICHSGHQQANGLCERTIQTLKEMMRKHTTFPSTNWVKFLIESIKNYNHTIHGSTNQAPYTLLYGKPANNSISDNLVTRLEDRDRNTVITELKTMRLNAQQNAIKAQKLQKMQYDKHRPKNKFQIGDKVMLLTETKHANKSNDKKKKTFQGLYEIIAVNGVNITIKSLSQENNGKEHTCHSGQLKLLKYNNAFDFTVKQYAKTGKAKTGTKAPNGQSAEDTATAKSEETTSTSITAESTSSTQPFVDAIEEAKVSNRILCTASEDIDNRSNSEGLQPKGPVEQSDLRAHSGTCRYPEGNQTLGINPYEGNHLGTKETSCQ